MNNTAWVSPPQSPRQQVEHWLRCQLPVPIAVVEQVWSDPRWRDALQHLLVWPLDAAGEGCGEPGLLVDAVAGQGVALEKKQPGRDWTRPVQLLVLHPATVAERSVWQARLGPRTQGVEQLHREVWLACADTVDPFAVHAWARTEWSTIGSSPVNEVVLRQAQALGFALRGRVIRCALVSRGQVVYAQVLLSGRLDAYFLRGGALGVVDGTGRGLRLSTLDAVALSEAQRMAWRLFAATYVDLPDGVAPPQPAAPSTEGWVRALPAPPATALAGGGWVPSAVASPGVLYVAAQWTRKEGGATEVTVLPAEAVDAAQIWRAKAGWHLVASPAVCRGPDTVPVVFRSTSALRQRWHGLWQRLLHGPLSAANHRGRFALAPVDRMATEVADVPGGRAAWLCAVAVALAGAHRSGRARRVLGLLGSADWTAEQHTALATHGLTSHAMVQAALASNTSGAEVCAAVMTGVRAGWPAPAEALRWVRSYAGEVGQTPQQAEDALADAMLQTGAAVVHPPRLWLQLLPRLQERLATDPDLQRRLVVQVPCVRQRRHRALFGEWAQLVVAGGVLQRLDSTGPFGPAALIVRLSGLLWWDRTWAQFVVLRPLLTLAAKDADGFLVENPQSLRWVEASMAAGVPQRVTLRDAMGFASGPFSTLGLDKAPHFWRDPMHEKWATGRVAPVELSQGSLWVS